MTLLLAPLAIVAPTPALEATLSPMGFPHAFLTYYTTSMPSGDIFTSGYEFDLVPAIADFVLWAGVALALVGLAALAFRTAGRLHKANPHPVP